MPFYVGGTAGLRNMGTYAAGTTYFPNDMVQYLGSTYVAVVTTTGNDPTSTSYWSVLAAKGADATGGGGPGPLLSWPPGRYFTAPIVNNGLSNTTVATSSTFYYPMRIPNPCTIGNLAVGISSYTNVTKYNVGVYADNPAVASGGPTTLLKSVVFTTSAAGNFITQPLNYTFTAAANVWVAIQAQNTSSQLTGASGSLIFNMMTSDITTTAVASAYPFMKSTTAHVYANGLPADVSAVTMNNVYVVQPLFFFQVTA